MIGIDVAMPVALAPIGMLGMQHADGEILAAGPPRPSACRSRSRP
jgi:isopentenyl diphosphate isomerase/L-lactate dehydrogenase-like FMN-dependent dehydrogenase